MTDNKVEADRVPLTKQMARAQADLYTEMKDRAEAADQRCERLAVEVERLSKSPWITEEGFRDAEDLLDMGRVGRSLMERIDDVRRSPGYEHWMPADDPAEIVCDLLNDLADEQTARRAAEAKLSALVEAPLGRIGLADLDVLKALAERIERLFDNATKVAHTGFGEATSEQCARESDAVRGAIIELTCAREVLAAFQSRKEETWP